MRVRVPRVRRRVDAFWQNGRRRSQCVCYDRFAALIEDDTESIVNNSPDECAEEVTTQEFPGYQESPSRRRRRLRIMWQEAAVQTVSPVMK